MGMKDQSSGEGPGKAKDGRFTSSSSIKNGAVPGVAFVLDMDGAMTHVNPAIERLLGGTPDELIGLSFLDLLTPESVEHVSQVLDSCLSGESRSGDITAKIVSKEGEVISLDMVVSPIRARGAAIGLCLLAYPILESGGTGRSFRMAHEEVLDFVPAAVLAFDVDFNITMFNKMAEQLTGYLREEVIGKPATSLLDQAGLRHTKIKETMDSAFERRTASYRVPLLTKKGEEIEVVFRTRVLTDSSGGPSGLLAISQEPAAVDEVGEETHNLGRNLERLAAPSADIVGTPDPAETIDQEMGRLIQSLSLDFAIFRMVGQDKAPLMFCSGIDFKKARELLESGVEGGLSLFRFAEKESPLVVDDFSGREDIKLNVSDIGSIVCLPLRHQEDSLGQAFFGSRSPLENVASILPVLQVFCNQVAISFGNARLSRELARRNRMLQSLHETSRALSGNLNWSEVLRLILQKARELVRADNAFLFEMDKKEGKLRCVANLCKFSQIVNGYELDLGEGITGIVASKGEGMLVERADLDDRSHLVEGTPDEPSSLISVPLIIGSEKVGVMTLEKTSVVPFTRSEYQLIEMFSLQAAVAIKNAYTFNKQAEFASTLQMYNVLLTHDVANYNVPIHGYLEMLITDPKLDARERRYVHAALIQSENITNLIRDVRDLTRLKTLENEILVEPVDLIRILEEAVMAFRSSCIHSGVEIRFEPRLRSAVTLADQYVQDIFYNILSNACKYGGGLVDVSLSEVKEGGKRYWRVDIADAGKGVADGRKVVLFKRYDQLDSTEGLEGHGLGLSVVGALCQRYSGRAWVEDRVPGDPTKGSVFAVLLPKAEASAFPQGNLDKG